MSEFRTFSGKTVDEAMEEACRQLGSPREKLEIEILSGGSSGIFGLVGKKKAQVRARIREEINLLEINGKQKGAAPRGERAPRAAQPPRPPKAAPAPAAQPEAQPEPETAPEVAVQSVPPVAADIEPEAAVDTTLCQDAPSQPEPSGQPEPVAMTEDVTDADEDSLAEEDEIEAAAEPAAPRPRREARPLREEPVMPAEPLTPELEALVREIMERMLEGILGQLPEFEVSGTTERVSVLVRDEDNSGLLIGREGQTLSAIQYLVNRMVIRRHGNPVKVQINTGEYRERQDDNLRKMAIFLADKAKSLGRPQSTKPLSSYHRRVVHLALQEDEAISTRSKGDGPLKRVLIVPRSRGESHNNGQRS